MSPDDRRFALVEREGWSENELFEGDTMEEVAEFLEVKTGDALDIDAEEVWD